VPVARPLAVILHNAVAPGAAPDERDVLVQATCAGAALERLGYDRLVIPMDLDIAAVGRRLQDLRPACVFNLVESLEGSGRLTHLAPALFEHLGLPFTGASSVAMLLTSCKPLAKEWLRAHGLATPAWATDGAAAGDVGGPWIVKSAWEDASAGLGDDSVVAGLAAARTRISACRARWGGEWFAERFIGGREFNLSLLASAAGPEVLPVAEICFIDFPADKPKVVGYRAKWDEESFECRHTVRHFPRGAEDAALCRRLREIAVRCWELFRMRGYARVDIRTDEEGQPWVLEVNANPCLSPDAGFAAALQQADVAFDECIARILADCNSPSDARPDRIGPSGGAEHPGAAG
jgi:D-alanine-D-alanine ligase